MSKIYEINETILREFEKVSFDDLIPKNDFILKLESLNSNIKEKIHLKRQSIIDLLKEKVCFLMTEYQIAVDVDGT
jgi:hypothetical protein